MTTHTFACPQCNTKLRSARPLSVNEMLRCPQCGNHFLPTSMLPRTTPATGHYSFLLLLIPAAIFAAVLGLGTVIGAYFLLRDSKPATPVVDQERDRLEKELAAERERNADLNRRGERPGDKKVREPIDTVKTDKDPTDKDNRTPIDADKRKAAYDKLMDQGKQAMTGKRYADAVGYFESALNLLPGDDATQALADARKELAKDDTEKKKLTDYNTFMDAGKAAADAGRYVDAIREFVAAQRIIPGDPAAARAQRDAEQKLAALKDDGKKTTDFNRLMDKAKNALGDKKYDAAIDGATAALRVMPGDAAATQLLADARAAKKQALADLSAAAAAARTAQRYDEAQRIYNQALLLSPQDVAILKAQEELRQLLAQQAGQATYNDLMAAGAAAMNAGRFADAVRAFTAALQLVPNDVAAAKGLMDAQRNLDAQIARQADFDRFMALGDAAMSKKLYNDAIAAYRDALKALPGNPLAEAGLKQAHYARDMTDGDKAMGVSKYADAITYYKDALKHVPGDQAAEEKLTNAHYRHGIAEGSSAISAKRYEDAIPFFEEALKAKPKDFTANEQLKLAKYGKAVTDGEAALQAKKYDDAITSFQDALKEKPNDGRATKGLDQARKLKKMSPTP
jgi:tetratricopeptide (TPR) repeat protein